MVEEESRPFWPEDDDFADAGVEIPTASSNGNVDDGSPYVDVDEAIDWESASDRLSSAVYDALAIVRRLKNVGNPANVDVHAFAYLACLMSVYKGKPASDWGYAFTAVPPTLPFSPAIASAVDSLVAGDLLRRDEADSRGRPQSLADGALTVTEAGGDELEFLSTLGDVEGRAEFIEAATATARLRSVPSVANALSWEPGVSQATRTSSVRMLLKDHATSVLYEQFELLDELLGSEHDNLVIPASLYLRFLDAQSADSLPTGGE